MTTFVLVHGSWHGPSAWDRLVPYLHEAGHHTITPDLDPDAGLAEHAEQVVAVLDEAARTAADLVLVGHSYAGLVVRQAADQRPRLVRHIILVDGWAGPDGAGLFDLAPEPFVAALRGAARPHEGGPAIPAPAPARYGVTGEEDARWLSTRLRPQALRSFSEPSRLTGAVDTISGTAVCCRPPSQAFEALARAIGYRTVACDGPHDIMVTHPEPLARLLLDAVTLQETEA
ncbi:alpha/beta fold hydrolase [Nonomuraea phyllanthi]|uniref:Alpha/beta fold hydrolase n=1 Tax=Nonomuraea phyllanthi TaxID=2219224 RepID=A0A5C4VJT2_9ACTN|nr:alpha/beta hydrolase [Nonomuraea phyllanthi]KAB8189145.1 alpha/beta fold hydrolase [Nonomuraea phyllanthi]QFY10236.1 alpha/beta fold hydrolase [Nonomuraea phyllanthi]